ncbi:MAG TPA: AbrB/MazE/SpoVT family DNA-binding domain-containing protein, partial [Nitriliruptorales bacterium]
NSSRRGSGSSTVNYWLPSKDPWWYSAPMSGTYTVVVGNKGRIVVPAEVRQRVGLDEGTTLVLLDTPDGLVLLTREQLRARVRTELDGLDLVSCLLEDRRREAQREDAA